MKAFSSVMYFSAVMLAPAVVMYAMLVNASIYIMLIASIVGGYSLYKGISELIPKISQIEIKAVPKDDGLR